MAVGWRGLPELHPVDGVRLGTACAGIKEAGRRDLVIMELTDSAACAAVFTRNLFCAAPVILAREHLGRNAPRYLLINTGNANAGTGTRGLADARACCQRLAELVGVPTERVLPFSTGVIGEPLPVEKIVTALPAALGMLDGEGWKEAAHGVMTTDTVPKGASIRLELDGETVTVTGIAKGAGMIRPDMATMLAFIATDAAIDPALLQRCLHSAVECSFNRITVDGDTSTNDACLLISTGRTPSAPLVDETDPRYSPLAAAVRSVCEQLAQAIVRDGEGATKFIAIEVSGGHDEEECLQVAYTIAHSPLVKTAFFASDPNWGRILAAIGRAGIPDLDIDALTVHLDEVCLVRDGGRDPDYREAAAQAVMDRDEITVRVDLRRGVAESRIWTCDLSHDYIRINAEYRT